jgi:hypothetical protein
VTRFLRNENDKPETELGYEDKLALSWYNKLFREFALVDLKHYKSAGGVCFVNYIDYYYIYGVNSRAKG